jgi:hypothetical protein
MKKGETYKCISWVGGNWFTPGQEYQCIANDFLTNNHNNKIPMTELKHCFEPVPTHIPFSIEKYKTGEYDVRTGIDGILDHIAFTGFVGLGAIVGKIKDTLYSWNIDGKNDVYLITDFDLFLTSKKPVLVERFLNVYKDRMLFHGSKEKCDATATQSRLSCIKITIDDKGKFISGENI